MCLRKYSLFFSITTAMERPKCKGSNVSKKGNGLTRGCYDISH